MPFVLVPFVLNIFTGKTNPHACTKYYRTLIPDRYFIIFSK